MDFSVRKWIEKDKVEWTASSMGTAGNFATVYEEKGKLSSVIRHFNYAYDLKSVSDEDIIKAIKLCKKTRKDFISIEISE
jgi:hypothetical protein